MSAELSLRALLEHPDAVGVTVLNGGDTAWTRVVVENHEDALPAEVDRALAVLVDPTPTASWQVDALLRRVHDRGFTGIALTGEPPGQGSCALARRLGLVVLHTQTPLQLARACWQLAEARDALTLRMVRRVARSIEYRANDLGDLLGHLAGNVGEGIALIDRDGVLQTAGEPIPDSLLAQVSFDHWLDIAESPDGLIASVAVESRTRHKLRVAMHGKDASIAYRNALSTAVQVVMPMVAARLLIDEVEAVSDASQSSGLLGDFLDSQGRVGAEVEQRMLAHGWRTSGYHLGFRMVGRGRLDQLELLRFVTSRLTHVPADSHAATRGGGVTGWLTFTETPSPAVIARRVQDLHAIHTAAQTSFMVATGVGSLAAGPTGLAATLGEARDAARLAADRERSRWFVHIDSLGLEQLLLAWTGGDTFASAAASMLSPLSEVERETLAAYLDEESSIVATADRLGLHRNTVSARIQRLQGLLGIDLRDPEARLALQLACRVAL
ncbi:MAG: PucR family transcriptional regulator [Intrasporangium sp.]|uniref:PucR family transcriptional regulator n=1 Tax=Intrasporangium sp. TaxID=1925024 RepID=UPI003F7FFE4A